MNTPICDFVNEYCEKKAVRMHMPGHKGKTLIGPEALDITEIGGADVLYEKDSTGIIAQSERNAAGIFGTAKTLYSTEGSSLCIRTMLYLVKMYAMQKRRETGLQFVEGADSVKDRQQQEKHTVTRRVRIAAGRNAHKTFITAAALMDLDVIWMYSDQPGLVSCELSPERIEAYIQETQPDAVYITSPDYLGNIADIRGIAEVCRRYKTVLLVDNAHGAYLKFIPGKDSLSLHPADLGADLCCDSAHKTLPVLTGGAYLHISENSPEFFRTQAEHAIKMFASTSPSYLILQSLDRANQLIADGFDTEIRETAARAELLKEKLKEAGYCLTGMEVLKITIDAAAYGYSGEELAQILEAHSIYSEFYDPEYLVLMISPGNTSADLDELERVLKSIRRRPNIHTRAPRLKPGEVAMRPQEAMLYPGEEISIEEAEDRILASADVACPPAIPIVVCGERISRSAIECFRYYGIHSVHVVK